MKHYNRVAIAGTFDRLHNGHRHFIKKAFAQSEKVLIGLTSDFYVSNKVKTQKSKVKTEIQDYEQRLFDLQNFLSHENLLDRAKVVPINDLYGPSVENKELEALVVTQETEKGARLVNERRLEYGHAPLDILVVDFLEAKDHMRISSTRIREGEIDKWGHVFSDESLSLDPITLNLRHALKIPMGDIIEKEDSQSTLDSLVSMEKTIITVGDVVTQFFVTHGRVPDIAIIDYVINRVPTHSQIEDLGFAKNTAFCEVTNPAGHITKELVLAIQKSIHEFIHLGNTHVIRVVGEEDLTGVPAILLAPLGSVVLYGQPGRGMVLVDVTEQKKDQLLKTIRENT